MSEADDRRIRQMIDAAAQALAAGRETDAERLVRQAEAEAPNHPLVLNEVGKRRLLAGDPAGALPVLEAAAKAEPENGTLVLNLATAYRDLGRSQDELAALNRVLILEPTNVRALLQAGALHSRLGDSRAAAATYRKALQMIPPNVQTQADMRSILAPAHAAVAANARALESFLEGHLSDARARHAGEPMGRFDKSLATFLQKRRVYRQQPTFLYVPELPAIEFYDRADFPWLDEIEAATDDIRAELIEVLSDGPSSLEPYVSTQATPDAKWRALNNSRSWGVFFLWKAGEAMAENQARCPRTMAALKAWPRCSCRARRPPPPSPSWNRTPGSRRTRE